MMEEEIYHVITSYYDETIILEYSKIDLNIMLEQMADDA